MAKRLPVPGSTLFLPGAGVYGRKALGFVFTCEAFSDGIQKTVYASVRITNNGEVDVCDYGVIKGQLPGTDQHTAMLFSDGVNEGAVEGSCLVDEDSRTQ